MSLLKRWKIGEPFTVIVSTSLCLIFTFGGIALIPISIGVLVDGYDFSLRQAGIVVSVEIAAMVATGTFLAFGNSFRSRARLAQVGCTLGAIGSLLSATNTDFLMLIFSRLIVGLGLGVITAAVNFSTASSSVSERLYAVATVSYGIAMIPLFAIAATVYSDVSYPSYFWLFCGLFLSGIFLTQWLLEDGSDRPSNKSAKMTYKDYVDTVFDPRMCVLYVATLLLWIAIGISWAISERMGVSIGLSAKEAGMVLSASNGFGLLGALGASFLGTRWGFQAPLLLCSGVLATGFLAISFADGFWSYSIALNLYSIGYFFMIPYVLGAAAEFDPTGRAATVNTLMSPVAHVITPSLSVVIAAAYSYQLVTFTSFLLAVLAAALFLSIGRFVDRASGLDRPQCADPE